MLLFETVIRDGLLFPFLLEFFYISFERPLSVTYEFARKPGFLTYGNSLVKLYMSVSSFVWMLFGKVPVELTVARPELLSL